MNTQIEKCFSDAEKRFLNDDEQGLIACFVDALEGRLSQMHTLEKCEADIVSRTINAISSKRNEILETFHGGKAAIEQELRRCIRVSAQSLVRDDEQFFIDNYADWAGEALLMLHEAETVSVVFECLRDSILDTSEPIDAKGLGGRVDMFLESLARWS